MKEIRICPLCGMPYDDPPALSRYEGIGDICPDCGMEEALGEWMRAMEEQEGHHEESHEHI